MLSGIFNYDNPIWRFIGKFCDIMILNVLWLICCIPVVTVGAATTAVYYVTLKLVRDEEGPTIRSFFKSFKENFKQATVLWLIMLAVGALLGFDLYFFLFIYKRPEIEHRLLYDRNLQKTIAFFIFHRMFRNHYSKRCCCLVIFRKKIAL